MPSSQSGGLFLCQLPLEKRVCIAPRCIDKGVTSRGLTSVAGTLGGASPFECPHDAHDRSILPSLYGRPETKPAFNAISLMTDPATPYGPYISLDGIHPNAAGHAILASAAAAALDARYGLNIPLSSTIASAAAPAP